MGGVWFPVQEKEPLALYPQHEDQLQQPLLWRAPFPQSMQDEIISTDNPTGTITNSDLELAGPIGHDAVLASEVPTQHLTTCTFTDNLPTVAWRGKGSVITTSPAAYLLQLSALHHHHHRYKNKVQFIPDVLNIMADNCSRLWKLPKCRSFKNQNLDMESLVCVLHLALYQTVLFQCGQSYPCAANLLTLLARWSHLAQ